MRRKPLPKPFTLDIFVQQPCTDAIPASVPQSSRAACSDGKPASRQMTGRRNFYPGKRSARSHRMRCTYTSRVGATDRSAASVERIAYNKAKP